MTCLARSFYVRSPVLPPSLAGSLETANTVNLFETVPVSAMVQNYSTARAHGGGRSGATCRWIWRRGRAATNTATHVYQVIADGGKRRSEVLARPIT